MHTPVAALRYKPCCLLVLAPAGVLEHSGS